MKNYAKKKKSHLFSLQFAISLANSSNAHNGEPAQGKEEEKNAEHELKNNFFNWNHHHSSNDKVIANYLQCKFVCTQLDKSHEILLEDSSRFFSLKSNDTIATDLSETHLSAEHGFHRFVSPLHASISVQFTEHFLMNKTWMESFQLKEVHQFPFFSLYEAIFLSLWNGKLWTKSLMYANSFSWRFILIIRHERRTLSNLTPNFGTQIKFFRRFLR